MKVFNACMLIIKRRLTTFIVYFVVFMALAVTIPMLMADQLTTDFSAIKPNFTIINRDTDSLLGKGLITFLSDYGVNVAIEDEKSALQDASFYNATDFIVIIPRGFHDEFMSGNRTVLETVSTTEGARGYYIDRLVNQYLNTARLYYNSGIDMSEDEIVAAVLDDMSLESGAGKKWFGEGAPVGQNFLVFTRMMPYYLLVINILCVTNITMVFKRPDIRMRNNCAPLKTRVLSGQQVLCCSILSVMAWLLITAAGAIMNSGSLDGVDSRVIALLLLNAFVFTIVALSVASLTGTIARSANAQNAMANILGLGLCFLGGVFVPLELFGEGILAVARFLPTYWNVLAQEQISALVTFDTISLTPVLHSFLIQMFFAAAFFCVTLVVSKFQAQSESAYGSIRTELEA